MTNEGDLNAASRPPLTSSEDDPENIWYFAYGSNMRTAVMLNRGIKPLATKVVVVSSYRLSFDIFGVPYSEPAMASITTTRLPNHDSDPQPVHGVALLLSKPDYVRLIVSEGAGTAYEEIEVEATPLGSRHGDKQDEFVTETLVAKYPFRQSFSPRPSQRYMNLLIEGAAEHNLPATYQEYLRSLPTFTRLTSTRAATGASIFHAVWLPTIQRVMRWIKDPSMLKDGKSPRWTGTVVWALFNAMWLHHDWIHARIWARGDGRLTGEVD